MVIFSTNKKNTGKKKGKNCLHEDDVGKKCLRKRICEYESNLRSYEHYSSSSERKPEKKFRPVRDMNL